MSFVAEIHHDHRDVNGGWLRPAVFGAADGLVSNFALMAGVAGGTADSGTVVIAGLAGLAAGAFSMAAGEYTSVSAQAELAQAEIDIERRELQERPHAELEELTAMFVDRGVDPELARRVATDLSADPELALDVHVRAELNLDPNDLPSPIVASVSSFLSFTAGALIPVLPYLFGATALWPATVLALIGLFGIGALSARVTSRSWWYSGARQLLLGSAAAAVTFLVGSAVGTQV
jgi:VIT1/CCC1 family predicted Fe2+/Mn2+ transporter